MKPKDFEAYFEALLKQLGDKAYFTGSSDEHRVLWKQTLRDTFMNPMPADTPKTVLINMFLTSLRDGRGERERLVGRGCREVVAQHLS